MFSLRSAQGRAILAGMVLVILLAGVAILAVWRVRDDQQRHHTLEHTSHAATTLEHAQAEFWKAQASLSALILLGDPSLADAYHDTAASLEQNLSQARAEALATGEADNIAALDDLIERIGHYTEKVNLALPIVLEAAPETRVQLATGSMSAMVSEAEAIIADLEALIEAHESDAAAATAAADRAANTTLWLLIGFSAAAFLVAAGTVSMLIVSVIRPLAALRASARAITAGEVEARAKVSGPEEVVSLARDFNEMTDALSAKTQEYIDTTNLTGDIIVRVGKDGNWTFLNDAACQFFGKPRQELLGVQFADYLHPEDAGPPAQAVQDMIESKELVRGFVNRQLTPLGTKLVEWNASPLFDEEGQYAGFQATGRDITERKQMEEELRESEERFRLLFENAKDAIIHADPGTGLITGCNRAAETLLERERGQIIGQPQAALHPPQKAQHYAEMFKRHIEEEGFAEDEAEVITKSGRIRSVLITASLASVRGKPIIQGVFRDITDRKRAEEALAENEKRLRNLVETTSDWIWEVDENAAYTYASPKIRDILGYEPEEVLGKTPFDLMPPEEAKRVASIFGPLIALQEPLDSLENTNRHKDGHLVILETSGVPILDDQGNLRGYRGIDRDITERKKAEEERERLQAELEVRAITDSLTGLYNHAHFYQRLAEEIDRSKRYGRGFALVMMDVDNFKQYNDSRGHQAGDEALCLVADCVRTGVRRSDIAFRYGGDEFAAILLHADSSRAQAIAKRMKRCLTRRLEEANDPAAPWLGLSTGIACFPDDATTADDLVKAADAALYDAKRVAHARRLTEQEQAIEPLATARAAGRSKG